MPKPARQSQPHSDPQPTTPALVAHLGPLGTTLRGRFALSLTPDKKATRSALLQDWKTHALFDLKQHQILVGTEQQAKSLNRLCQAARLKALRRYLQRDSLEKLGTRSFRLEVKRKTLPRIRLAFGEESFHPGDRVRFAEATRQFGFPIKEGELGTIDYVTPAHKALTVELDSGKRAIVPLANWNHLTLAYALTPEKASHSQASHAYILASPELDKNILHIASHQQTTCYINDTQLTSELVNELTRISNQPKDKQLQESPSRTADHPIEKLFDAPQHELASPQRSVHVPTHALLQHYTEQGGIVKASDVLHAKERLIEDWSKHGLENPKDHLIITTNSVDAQMFNEECQAALRAALTPSKLITAQCGLLAPQSLGLADRVICTVDDAEDNLVRGALGTVVDIDNQLLSVHVAFDAGHHAEFSVEHFSPVALGYAVPIELPDTIAAKHTYLFSGVKPPPQSFLHHLKESSPSRTTLYIQEKHLEKELLDSRSETKLRIKAKVEELFGTAALGLDADRQAGHCTEQELRKTLDEREYER